MPLGQAWTLCYEEQFYAIAGLILLVCPRRFFWGICALTIATLPWFGSSAVKGFFFDGSWLSFAGGVLVYHALNYQSKRQQIVTIAVLLMALGYACRNPSQ